MKTLVPYSKLIRALNNDRKTRKKEGLFVLEGPKLLEEALDAGLNFRVILVGQSLNDQGLLEKAKKRAPLFVIEDKEVQSLSSTVTPQGVIAVLEVPQYTLDDIEKEPFFLVLDGIQDPGNLGTLFRTALASGAGGLILIKNTVDPFNPKVVRSAMGALFKLPFVTDISIDELTNFSTNLWAAVLEDAKAYYQLKPEKGVGLIIGNEGQGISQAIVEIAKEKVYIPIDKRSESLNAAIAAGVLLFYLKEHLG